MRYFENSVQFWDVLKAKRFRPFRNEEGEAEVEIVVIAGGVEDGTWFWSWV